MSIRVEGYDSTTALQRFRLAPTTLDRTAHRGEADQDPANW